jgi:Zn finger protein HypA/HybF involved in hydrogenase expression
MKIDIPKLYCKRCGHEWYPKQPDVRICPKCKSPYWDRDRNVNK